MVTVGEHGGDEDQLIAAVLHDYLEDIEGASLEDVRHRFGDRVARIVGALSDSESADKPPWEERKRRYLAELRREPHDVKLVSAADKLHNARCILRDFRAEGNELWNRFNAPAEKQVWYYRALVEALADGWTHPLLDELHAVVREIDSAVSSRTFGA